MSIERNETKKGQPAIGEMNYGQGFRFVFQDKEWITKILLGILISLVPIFSFVVAGYSLEVMRRVASGRQGLPSWGENIGRFFVQGFFVIVLQLSYCLPVIAFFVIGILLVMLNLGLAYSGVVTIIIIIVFTLCALVALAAFVLLPMAMMFYARSGRLADAYQVKQIFKTIGPVVGEYLLSGVIVVGISLAFSIMFWPMMTMPFFGPLFGYFFLLAFSVYSGWIAAHYLGQLYALSHFRKVIKERGFDGRQDQEK